MQADQVLKLQGSKAEVRLLESGRAEFRLPNLFAGYTAKPFSPADFTHVYLERRVYRRDGADRTSFHIGLQGGGQRLEMGEITGDYHNTAEELARFLNLGMEDSSRGSTITRAAGQLDESLRQRAARSGQPPQLPVSAPHPLLQVKLEGETMTFFIPGQDYDLGKERVILQGFAVFSLFLGLVHWVLPVLILGCLAWAVYSVKRKYSTPVAVAVNPQQLVLQTGGQPGMSFSADEIEELQTWFPSGVRENGLILLVRTDRGVGHVELRAPEASNRWIADTVLYLLSEDPQKIDWQALSPPAAPVRTALELKTPDVDPDELLPLTEETGVTSGLGRGRAYENRPLKVKVILTLITLSFLSLPLDYLWFNLAADPLSQDVFYERGLSFTLKAAGVALLNGAGAFCLLRMRPRGEIFFGLALLLSWPLSVPSIPLPFSVVEYVENGWGGFYRLLSPLLSVALIVYTRRLITAARPTRPEGF